MSQYKIAISSPSLGQHHNHALEDKIKFAVQNGFNGIEIVYADLETFGVNHQFSIHQAARAIRNLCQRLNMTILSLAAFENFEGSNEPLDARLEKAKVWIEVAASLGAIFLQVPAQYDEKCRLNQENVVPDLQKLADLASASNPSLAIAYEPMSWSVHNSTWEEALQTVSDVNRDNFGLCLDSFHIITKLWASPFEPTGKLPNADRCLTDNLKSFCQEFPLNKLFYVQLSDGERFDPPFSKSHPWYVEGEAPQFTWSRHARPFPLEQDMGGYMPVTEFLKESVVNAGFEGWISMEIFDRRMRAADFDPQIAARRGRASWQRLLEQVSKMRVEL